MQPLNFVAFLAVLAAVPAAVMLGSPQAVQPHPDKSTPLQAGQDPTLLLRQDMRKLWSDHVIWTRDYIIAAAGDQPDQKVAAGRLMKNQEDIGGAIAVYYGRAAGDQLTALLKEHIQIAADLISAARSQDQAKVKEADGRWHKNAEEISVFLSKANPNWSKADLVEMMNMHLSTTTNEVTARLAKDWDADVKAFDAVYDHILKMSDVLSAGIIKQFPERFSSN